MALAALAVTADLGARAIVVPDTMNAAALLDSASDAVRDAAGCPIVRLTSTITLVVDDRYEIELPAGPVSAVSSVMLGEVAVTGWRKLGDTLVMPCTRWSDRFPVEVTITYTHGLVSAPTDIVDLVCALVGIASGQEGGYGEQGLLQSERLGDWSATYKSGAGAEASISPMWIPDNVRDRLRARFNGSVAVIGTRR